MDADAAVLGVAALATRARLHRYLTVTRSLAKITDNVGHNGGGGGGFGPE